MTSPVGLVDRSYLLHEPLGEGGMGAVYRATRLVNGEVVALKLVSPRLRERNKQGVNFDVKQRLALAREFQTLASLHHPYIHQRGIVHRDIKPSNVLVVRGEVKLPDFGIAIESHERGGFAQVLDRWQTAGCDYAAQEARRWVAR